VSGWREGGKADLLTETMGFDFGPYITQLVKTVKTGTKLSQNQSKLL
jgi:hypothetical protein